MDRQTLRAYKSAGLRNPPADRDIILFLVDLDHFKNTNDTHGHAAGDRVLVEAARRLNSVVRHAAVLLRWGGEEFLIVSQGNNRDRVRLLAQRILDALGSAPFDLGSGVQHSITCSVGWAPFPWNPAQPEAFSLEEVISLGDRGLYLAKTEGRNRSIGMLPSAEPPPTEFSSFNAKDLDAVRDLGPAAAVNICQSADSC